MATIILIHGTLANPGLMWYPAAVKALKKRGHTVLAPLFPTPFRQDLETWTEEFEPYKNLLGPDTILIGHSIGATFALRILEAAHVHIKAAFLVAGFSSNPGAQEYSSIIDSFVQPPFNWQAIKHSCQKFYVYGSDNDEFVPSKFVKELATRLSSPVITVQGAGHFRTKKFTQLIKDIDALEKSQATKGKTAQK